MVALLRPTTLFSKAGGDIVIYRDCKAQCTLYPDPRFDATTRSRCCNKRGDLDLVCACVGRVAPTIPLNGGGTPPHHHQMISVVVSCWLGKYLLLDIVFF